MDYRPLFGDLSASNGLDTNALLASGQKYPPPTSLQIFAIAIIIVFPALALVTVIIRSAGRIAIRQFGWDDWLICIAMLLSVAETIISYFFIKTNFIGIHEKDIPENADQTTALIWLYAVQILYNPILSLVKSSVLIFLLRLFGQKDGVRRFIIGLNIVNIVQMVAVFFVVTLQCLPIQFNWDLTISNGRCIDRRILYTFTSSFNIVTDLLMLGLPLWIFVDLKIPRRTKIALIFVFLLSFAVTITSVVRLVILVQGLFGLVVSTDPTFNIGFVVSAIETNLAIITASAPALRLFFRSRERGGWLGAGRSAANATTKSSSRGNGGNDVEAATTSNSRPFGWPLRTPKTPKTPKLPSGGNRLLRGGSRGGRRGGRSGRGGRGGSTKTYDIRIRRDADLLRSQSPRSSGEEMTMTTNGIMRVSDIQREIDGIVREIAVEGAGTYTGRATAARTTSPPPSRRGPTAPRLLTSNLNITTSSASTVRPTTSGSSRDSNINDFRNTGFDFFNRIPPPSEPVAVAPTRIVAPNRGRQQFPAERYYSESIYPEQVMDYYTATGTAGRPSTSNGDVARNFGEERLSKYGEKRFGVVTPRSGMTPTATGWRESGRPF